MEGLIFGILLYLDQKYRRLVPRTAAAWLSMTSVSGENG